MSTVLSILGALILLSVLVTVHELGHYLMGCKLGFTIVEFAVGMGPAIWKKEKNGITYALRALPIGGMCRFYGEDQEVVDGRCFNAKPAWKKILVVAAGPVMNLLLAVLLSIVTLAAYGNYVPQIYEIPETDSPAYRAGLQPGDIIVKVDGDRIDYYNETTAKILAASGERMVLTVDRGGALLDIAVEDAYNAELGRNYIGITMTAARQRYGFFQSVGQSFRYVGSIIRETFGFFGTLFQGRVQSTDVAGPVGTIAYISEAVRYGFETVLQFAVLINVSLGIFNLLPIPALDGGRLVFLVIEAIRGKPIDARKEGMVHFVGLIALFALIIFLTYNDIINLIRG